MPTGQDLIEIASQKIGQEYKLGALVPFEDGSWNGPWDCAEFVTWAIIQAGGELFGARPADYHPSGHDAWTGHWETDRRQGKFVEIDVSEALATPGAILLRAPNTDDIRIGHIAFSRGDTWTVEAHSKNVGVTSVSAQKRYWRHGLLLPGFTYERAEGDYWYKYPKRLWRLTNPYTHGKDVMRIKRKLKAKGFDPDMDQTAFNQQTHEAVVAFQEANGLIVDGIVGADTLKALGFVMSPEASAG